MIKRYCALGETRPMAYFPSPGLFARVKKIGVMLQLDHSGNTLND